MEGIYIHECDGLRIYAISDHVLDIPLANFSGAEPARANAILGQKSETIAVTVNCFLVETAAGDTCLVDTGVGRAVPGVEGALAARLSDLGITPGKIFLSHFHIDHIGGLVTMDDLADAETEILVPKAELAYWTQPGFPLQAPEGQGRSRPVVAALLERFAGRLRPVDRDVEPLPDLRQMPLPGHTPGHTGFSVGDVVIWGDIVHSAALQCAEPDWGYIADVDAGAAARQRKEMFAAVAESGTLIAGMHLPSPGLGHLHRIGKEGYRFLPV